MESAQIFTFRFENESFIEKQQARCKRIETRTPWLVFFLLGVLSYLLVWSLSDFPRDTSGLVGSVLAAAVISLVFTFSLGVAGYLDSELRSYTWLPVDRCASLSSLCERNPGLQPYRNKVREAARRFTQGEADAMQEWDSDEESRLAREATEAKDQAACRKLYGIASSDDVGTA